MSKEENQGPYLKKLKEFQTQVNDLEQQLEETNAINKALWSLLAESTKRLQVSSAAIKAAVSSLLDYDIFWDGSTQHELLEIINSSTDYVSSQITLLSLTFLSESNKLNIKSEINSVPEILSTVLDSIVNEYPDLNLIFETSPDLSPAVVDYDYLSVALKLFFEVVAETQSSSEPIKIFTFEKASKLNIHVVGLNNEIVSFISIIPKCVADEFNNLSTIIPVNRLKLLVMCRILSTQNIQLEQVIGEKLSIQLSIPIENSSDHLLLRDIEAS